MNDKMKTLDLHGFKHKEVEEEVEKFVNDNWGIEESTIITGNSKAMRDVVIGVLDYYKVEYTVGNYMGTDTSFIKVDLS